MGSVIDYSILFLFFNRYETLDADDIKAIMNGEKVKIERLGRATKDSSPSSAPSAPSGAGLLGAPHPAPA